MRNHGIGNEKVGFQKIPKPLLSNTPVSFYMDERDYEIISSLNEEQLLALIQVSTHFNIE